ncbi:hypothetical protein G7Y89_g3137 [Cudoniella acicularis]|uniref:Uncharacterized protein n=1 Tax=Cudoniella acicularis TaxID=354080 RepID=A0A8H4RU17_9HELO|nr:hypothetical protein G7Y89_g3137 [Cudoniella acicularis]
MDLLTQEGCRIQVEPPPLLGTTVAVTTTPAEVRTILSSLTASQDLTLYPLSKTELHIANRLSIVRPHPNLHILVVNLETAVHITTRERHTTARQSVVNTGIGDLLMVKDTHLASDIPLHLPQPRFSRENHPEFHEGGSFSRKS